MTKNEVKRLGKALALQNGHDDPETWAEALAAKWHDVGHPDKPKDEPEPAGDGKPDDEDEE